MRFAIVLNLAFAFVTPLFAQPKTADWPQWRGPLRDGICTETGLLTQWPEKGPPLLWDAKTVNKGKNVGTGYSSLAVADGKVFTLGDRDKKGNVICLDEATGKVLWATPFSDSYGDGGSRCTPTVAGGKVYGLSPQGDLVCALAADGKIVWRKQLKTDFGGMMMSEWNYSESPTVDGDRLIVTPGGKDAVLVALNKDTGDVIWKCAAPKESGAGYASIVSATVGGEKMYITLLGQELGLVGVNAKTGKFLWSYPRVANGTANIPTPIVKGDQVFASTGYGTGAALLRLIPSEDGAVRAEEVYFLKANKVQNHHGGMVMLGDYIYGGHGDNRGNPFCLEWKTGKLAWGPLEGPGGGSAAVLYADGHLYFRYDNNVMALIEATPTEYKLKGEFNLPKGASTPGWSHPVIHNGRLYLRGVDQVYCYDIKRPAK